MCCEPDWDEMAYLYLDLDGRVSVTSMNCADTQDHCASGVTSQKHGQVQQHWWVTLATKQVAPMPRPLVQWTGMAQRAAKGCLQLWTSQLCAQKPEESSCWLWVEWVGDEAIHPAVIALTICLLFFPRWELKSSPPLLSVDLPTSALLGSCWVVWVSRQLTVQCRDSEAGRRELT